MQSAFSRFFWTRFHRSDASASWRWAAAMSVTLALMPTFGSVLSVLVIGMALLAWLYILLDPSRFRLKGPAERLIALSFLLYFVLGLLISQVHANRLAGFQKIADNIGFVLALPLLPVLRESARPFWSNWFKWAVAGGGILVGAVAAIQSTSGNAMRIEAFVGNALILSYLAGVTGLVCLCLLLYERGGLRPFYAVGLLGSLVALVLSGGRAPLLFFLVAATGVAAAWLVAIGRIKWRRAALALYLSLCALAIAYQMVHDTRAFSVFVDRVSEFGQAVVADDSADPGDQSLDRRLQMYRVGWSAFLKSPILGYGRQNVMAIANEQFPDDPELGVTHLHNAYLTEAVAAGIPGFLSLLLILAAPVLAFGDAQRPLKSAGYASIGFTFLFFLTNIGFYHDIMVFYFCILVFSINSLASFERERGGFGKFVHGRWGILPDAGLAAKVVQGDGTGSKFGSAA